MDHRMKGSPRINHFLSCMRFWSIIVECTPKWVQTFISLTLNRQVSRKENLALFHDLILAKAKSLRLIVWKVLAKSPKFRYCWYKRVYISRKKFLLIYNVACVVPNIMEHLRLWTRKGVCLSLVFFYLSISINVFIILVSCGETYLRDLLKTHLWL